MLKKMGMLLIILGICTADSSNLIVPLASMAIGLFLIRGVIEW